MFENESDWQSHCKIPYEDFDPDVCAEEGNWDDVYGGIVDCTECKYFKGVPDEGV